MGGKHIGLIYTGGTVGMHLTARGYAPAPDFPDRLQALLAERDVPRYTLHAYEQANDSANACPEDWLRMARDIVARHDEHDGFVVLHGTDTMAYSASALSYMLQGLRKPVVLTGSQIPLSVADSDAPRNLITSLRVAASAEISEVAICFGGRLLRGNRATKSSTEQLCAFDSPNYPWLAEVNDELRLNPSVLLLPSGGERFQLPTHAFPLVLPIRFVPGMPVRVVQALLELRPQAVILQCYGSGNVPDSDPDLFRLLARASEQGTVLVACSQSPHGRVAIGNYAAGAGLKTAGVMSAGDMTFEAIYAKLHYLFGLGLSPESVRTQFLMNLSGELTS